MASTITPTTVTVTLTEAMDINNSPLNSTNTLLVGSVNEVDKRIVTIPTASEVTVMAFGSAVAAGTFIAANVKYIRIANKDDTNFVRIRVTKSGADTFDIKLAAGQFFIMGNVSESVSATAVAFSAFVNATGINAQADTAAVDIEVFVISI